MNSYPTELLTQLAPVMFVGGLDITPATLQAPPQAASPQSPPQAAKTQDPFALLTLRLREALLTRKPAIWQPEKSKSFQVFLVGRHVQFPPRKLVPPEDPQYTSVHSPLSPLTPSSPLHPDGLMAPIWIRKHTTLIPSVFVLFLRIFESPLHSRSPLDGPDAERERERDQEERRKDSELAAEVALRKKSTNERGIKLTVVLMASRKMLDDPSLDARLTFIRRQSGLDSRAALFVLSPVSTTELGDFVKSLQQALYESSLEYYTNHSKRVRRKRNRHSQVVSTYPNALAPTGNHIARPLRPEGWTVRYEYKMACFAEFRGEDEVALKHYQDAYAMLVIMFGSTAILPPRTKRWAEAKVLADCISVKVAKLYLYNNEHALALSHHNTHMRKFGDFSRGWGIGEETFEFWSWMARQHRVLAELLEEGTRSTLTIPSHCPAVTPSTTSATSPTVTASQVMNVNTQRGLNVLDMDAMRAFGINPSHALQHPGFYYYMAARCTEMRRERFLVAVEAELSQHSTTPSPGFANEKKVDHLTIVLELYTKSYELFKKYSSVNNQNQNQGRLTLWIAFRIAQTYYDSGKFDMAVRFFERIAKTYRREKWRYLLRPLLTAWYTCAQQLGDVELSVRLLVEMLGHGPAQGEEPGTLEEDLLAVLKSTAPSSKEPILVNLSESQPIFESTVVFWTPEVKVGEPAAFQLSLTAPTNTTISSLPFTSLAIYFSDNISPVTVRHLASGSDGPSVQRIDLGDVSARRKGNESKPQDAHEVNAYLRWQPGATTVFSGTISSDVPTSLKISKLVLTMEEGTWKIDVPFDPCSGSRFGPKPAAKWLSSLEPARFVPLNPKGDDFSTISVRHRPHRLLVSLLHQSPAYLDEDYPITIDVTNEDDRELDIFADVLLQPTEIDKAVNSIILGDERSSGLIKGVPFGVIAPGVTVVKTLYLVNTGAAGDRMIDISIQSRATTTAPSYDINPSSPDGARSADQLDVSETLQTLVVPTVEPIKVVYETIYRRALGARPGLADLRTFESEFWDDGEGGEAEVIAKLECVGPWSLEVGSVKLLKKAGIYAKVIECSSDGDDEHMFPAEYLAGDEFTDVCRISLAPENGRQEPIPGPGEYEITWRRTSPAGAHRPTSTTYFPLPPLTPPTDGLVALLSVPPTAKLHVPILLTLTIRNHHPSRSANIIVQLESDPSSSGFVIAGMRSGRVPILMPGAEETLNWRLVPVECGYVKVPGIKVMDRRKTIASAQGTGGVETEVEVEAEVVGLVDVRWDRRAEAQESGEADSGDSRGQTENRVGSVLVLP